MRPPYDETEELSGTETDWELALLSFKKSWPRTSRIAGLIVSIFLRLLHPVATFRWLGKIAASQIERRR